VSSVTGVRSASGTAKEIRAVARVPIRWRKASAGIISDIEELCDTHKQKAEAANKARMRRFGILCACKRPHIAPDGLCRRMSQASST
jgi:hypothetical protein